MTALIETEQLFCVYPTLHGGVAALQGLTLEVEAGEVCVVLGPSGSGKTTLMRVLAGLERPSAGVVHVAGHDLSRLSQRRLARYRAQCVGYADQHYWLALAGELTAVELVAVPLGLAGIGVRERRRRALAMLERVGLDGRAAARPGELSGGEQQRIALAAALVCEPAVLVADEPTGELDAASAEAVFVLLEELVRERGTTAVVVSHDVASTRIADRVVHLRDGRISEEGGTHGDTAVVGAGGWLRISEDVLRAAGIDRRARVARRGDIVELQALADDAPTRSPWAVAAGAPGRAGVIVVASGLSRTYGTEVALDRFSARFEPGALTVVTGPSGSGKSTLLALIAGLDVPDAGEVVVGDTTVSSLDRDGRALVRRGLIGYVDQAPALPGYLSARETVELGLALLGLDEDDVRGRAGASLGLVGLGGEADREVGRLSAGQRERVALARALASQPAALVVDEPTSRLDLATTADLGRVLAGLAHEVGTTVICATHDDVLVDLADRVVQLDRRRPVRSGRGRPHRDPAGHGHPL